MSDREKFNREYRDWFEKSDSDSKEDKPTYYYSYGPFRPHEKKDEVEMIQPQPLHTYNEPDTAPFHDQHDRRPVRSMFFSFLAGMIVIAALMFAADHFNLFTGGDQAVVSGISGGGTGSKTGQLAASSSGEGSVRNAALATARPDNIPDIVEGARPAVVKIETFGTASPRSSFNDDFFRYFFGDGFQQPRSNEKRQLGAGSGFIFDSEGYILTNEHVVSGADEIEVTVLGSKEPYKAKLLGSDFNLDLAVLKIDGDEPFPTLIMGDSSNLRVGDWVTAIGNPLGFDHTVSVGVLSANEREIQIPAQQGVRRYEHLLQTDAAINSGNSGGPLLDMNGEVIGINTAVSAQAQGIGFAIPTSTVSSVLDRLKNNEPIPRPYIGVGLTDINESWVDELGLDNTDGTIVTQVQSQSSASRAGLRPYDVIIAMNGERVKDTQQFVDAVKRAEIGERLSLTIIRDGEQFETAVTVGDRNQ